MGTDVIYCQANGSWSSSGPRCLGKIQDIIKSHLLNFSDTPLQLDFAVAET